MLGLRVIDSHFTIKTILKYYDQKVLTRITQHVAAALARVDSKIEAVAHLKIKKVDSLPTSNISTDTIYLVPKATAEQDEQNVLLEYIYVDNEWEIIGDMEVDLSDYMKTADANSTFLSKTDASNTYLTKTVAGNTYATAKDLETVRQSASRAETTANTILQGVNPAKKAEQDASGNDIKTTYATKKEVEAAIGNVHTHTNKAILDATTASYTTAKDTKLSGIEEKAEVNIIETIKVAGLSIDPVEKVVDITKEKLQTALGTATPSLNGLMSSDQATQLSNAVPKTRKVNGKALSGDITTCIYQGEYVSGSTYYMGDIVCYERSFWQCVKESTSAEPTANLSTTWVELARAITNDEIDALFE